MSNPSIEHFKALDYLQGYINSTASLGLDYCLNNSKQSTQLELYNSLQGKLNLISSVDADQGGNYTTRKSTTGYIFLLNNKNNNSAISQLSKLQKTVAFSSCKAKFIAYKEAAKESIYLNNFIRELFIETSKLFNKTNVIYTDS